MKTIIAICCLFTFIHTYSQQNCHRTGPFTDGGYSVSGNAYLEVQSDASLKLFFDESFNTSSGPDLDIYLSNTTTPGQNSVLIDSLHSISGYQEYEIPDNIGLDDYDYVVIYCTEFSALWGYALLGTNYINCATGSLSKRYNPEIKFTRVHTNKQILISSTGAMINKIIVYDVMGKEVLKQSNISAGQYHLDISNLANGMYVISVDTEINIHTKKIVNTD